MYIHKCYLTLHTAAAGLQDPSIHVRLGVGQQLISSQVGVVGRGYEIVTQRLIHVLIDLVVLRVEHITDWAPHVAGEP